MELDTELPTVVWYENEVLVSNAEIKPDTIYRIIDFDENTEVIGGFFMEDDVPQEYYEYKENIIPGSVQEKWHIAQNNITDRLDDMVDNMIADIITTANTLDDLKLLVKGKELNQSDGKAILIFTTPLSDKEYIGVSTSWDSDKWEWGVNE